MSTGSCLCGRVKVEYSGEPKMTARCHCINCRRITGSLFSHNILIARENFSILGGTLKEVTITGDSGKTITNCFCDNCGTTVYRYGDSFGGKDGVLLVQGGILDDSKVLTKAHVNLEMFVPRRVEWIPAVEGVPQFEAMPNL